MDHHAPSANVSVGSNPYAATSSLYGPGIVVGWYLTMAAVFISWTLHPEKKKRDFVDVDLIAILTLPAVAAGHLLVQLFTLQYDHERWDTSGGMTRTQALAAVQAPFIIIEQWTTLGGLLVSALIATGAKKTYRAPALVVVAIFCQGVEFCMINLEWLGVHKLPEALGGEIPDGHLPLASSAGFYRIIRLTLAICVWLSAASGFLHVVKPKQIDVQDKGAHGPVDSISLRSPPMATSSANHETFRGRLERLQKYVKASKTASTILQGIRVVWTALLGFLGGTLSVCVLHDLHSWTGLWIPASMNASRQIFLLARTTDWLQHDLLPRTSCSLRDIDQAVAAFAGGVVLAVRFFLAAKAQYTRRKNLYSNNGNTPT